MFGFTYRKRRERIRKRKEKYFPLGVFGYREEWKEKKKRYISFFCLANGRERENVCFHLYAVICIYPIDIFIYFFFFSLQILKKRRRKKRKRKRKRKDISFVFIRF